MRAPLPGVLRSTLGCLVSKSTTGSDGPAGTKWVTLVSTGRRIDGSFRREGTPLPITKSR